MTYLFGYSLEDLTDMALLYVFDNKEQPKDVYAMLQHYASLPCKVPRDCAKIACRLSAALDSGIDVEPAKKLVLRFIENFYGKVSTPTEQATERK